MKWQLPSGSASRGAAASGHDQVRHERVDAPGAGGCPSRKPHPAIQSQDHGRGGGWRAASPGITVRLVK